MKDSFGDRMKDHEHRTRYFLPRRTYTLIRIDGKAFHSYTKFYDKPFDLRLVETMQKVTEFLCKNIQGCKLGYTQSDEITLLLTDFDDVNTQAWFDGNLQKIVSISASLATAKFNEVIEVLRGDSNLAFFDSRAWTISDPWEVYNTFLWRQQDATRNSIQMIAHSLASHKECDHKNTSELQELIHERGQNFDSYPVHLKRGTFVYKELVEWKIDEDSPILSKQPNWFFSKIPSINQSDIYNNKYWSEGYRDGEFSS